MLCLQSMLVSTSQNKLQQDTAAVLGDLQVGTQCKPHHTESISSHLLLATMQPNTLNLPLWKTSHTVFVSGGKKSAFPFSVCHKPTLLKTCPWFPIWMPSRQCEPLRLSLPGISSLWRQLRPHSIFLLINYRSSFSLGFTSSAGL